MARRFTDWDYPRWLIENNLSGKPGFPARVQLESRLSACGSGLSHENYGFAVGARGLVLRVAKAAGTGRTPTESGESLEREAETLRQLAASGCDDCRSRFSGFFPLITSHETFDPIPNPN